MSPNEPIYLDDSVPAVAWRWVVRLDELSNEEQAELDRWLQESDVHRAEFEAARQAWQSFAVLKLSLHDTNNTSVAKQYGPMSWTRRYAVPMAATLAVVVIASWWLFPLDNYAVYHTAIGEQKTISLPDDSVVKLNTNTRLNVQFTRTQRTVLLEQGEAYFEVVHDPRRRFEVVAGEDIVLRAVGTAFTVREFEHDEVDVTVTDGAVEILRRPQKPDSSAALVDSPDQHTEPVQRLTEGQNARIRQTIEDVTVVDPETLARKLSWRDGMLVFVNAPLNVVVAEAERYTVKDLEITDVELETHPVTIVAKASNIDALLQDLDDSSKTIEVTFVSDSRVLIAGARPR
jgi:transmembrane sensor